MLEPQHTHCADMIKRRTGSSINSDPCASNQNISSIDQNEDIDIIDGSQCEQPFIQFYHKQSLSDNGIIKSEPSNIPIQLFWKDDWLLGLPLNQLAVTEAPGAFDESKPYVVVSWPEQHAIDEIECRWIQTLFCFLSAFNLISITLYLTFERSSSFPTRVEPILSTGVPGPFNKLEDDSLYSIVHCSVNIFIGLFGIGSMLSRRSFLLSMFLYLVTLNFFTGFLLISRPFLTIRYVLDIGLASIARNLRNKLTIQWTPMGL